MGDQPAKPKPTPKPGNRAVQVRLAPTQVKQLDKWIARQPDPKPTREEALRAILRTALRAAAD